MAHRNSHSADCGCCAGVDSETPRRVENATAQSEIAYRVGDHARFKESLLARLSSSAYTSLRALGTRDDDDFTIALCDALATSLDVLTFYQERVANENYLRTATEERSVHAMARLIGYRPSPGVAASAFLAFTLQETPGDTTQSAAPVTIGAGTPVQSVPGPDEKPQTFETSDDVEARTEWNAVAAQTCEPWRPSRGDKDLYLAGADTGLQPGDAILIVGKKRSETDTEGERWDVRVLSAVEPDTGQDRTRVSWADGLGHASPYMDPAAEAVQVFAFRQRAALFGHNAPDPNVMSEGDSNLGELIKTVNNLKRWKNFAISKTGIDLDAAYPKVTVGSWVALVSNQAGMGSPSLPGYVELYRAKAVRQVSRSDFGLSAKITRIEPDTPENLDNRFTLCETLALVQTEELAAVSRPLREPIYGDTLALEHLVDGLAPDRPVAVSGKRPRIAIAPGVNDLSLTLDDGETVALSEGDSLFLLEAPVRLIGSTTTYLQPAAFASLLGQAGVNLSLRLLDRDSDSGTLICKASEVVLQAALEDDPQVAEMAMIASDSGAIVHDRDRTHLRFADAFTLCYERASVRLNLNVVRATHGETVEEILGAGDAGRSDQKFTLRQRPLTYVSADTPSGGSSTSEIRVNDLLWTEVPTLFQRGGDERVYTIDTDESGAANVCFGDGVEGARLPSGQNNVRAVYRKGLGTDGNVEAAALTNLLKRPLGVKEVINSEPAGGGADRESLDDARGNAPLTVLTLDRAVSVKDYADFARAFAGIAKAHALWIPAGPSRGVFLTVAGIDGAPVSSSSETYVRLKDALRKYGDPLVPIHLHDRVPVGFETRLAIEVDAVYEAEIVLEAVDEALREAFGFEARSFGQGVSVDEIAAVAHGVDGVVAVKVTRLHRPGAPASPPIPPRLFAALPVASLTATPDAAELLTLDNERLELKELA